MDSHRPDPLNPTERRDLQSRALETAAGQRRPDEAYPYIRPEYGVPYLHIGTERQLFLDNFILDELTDVERRFPEPERAAEPVLEVGELPWERENTVLACAALQDPDDGRFRLWYNTAVEDDPYGDSGMIMCCAESDDGVQWVKPLSDRCLPFGDLRETNIVLEDSGHHIGLVLNCDQSDPERRYLLVFNPHDEARSQGKGVMSCVAASPDGLRWTRIGGDSALRHHHKQAIIWDPAIEKWIGYGQYSHHWNYLYHKRQVGRQESADFRHWTPKEVVLSADHDPNLPPHIEYHDMSVRKVGGLYIGIATEFVTDALWSHSKGVNWRDTAVARLSLQTSRDGIHWHRVGGPEPWFDNGPPGSLDAGNCCYTVAGQLTCGGRNRILYSASNDGQHWFDRDPGFDILPEGDFVRAKREWSRTAPPRRRTVGMLSLREDGWAELRPPGQGGRVLTKQFVFEGDQLRINAEASRGGVRVAVLDPLLRPYEGFSAQDCDPVASTAPDQIWHTVSWRGNPDVSSLWNRPVRLEMHLDQASLYGFQFHYPGGDLDGGKGIPPRPGSYLQ